MSGAMSRGWILLALGALCVPGASAREGQVRDELIERAEARAAALRLERERDLRRLYVAADAELRAQADALLRAGRDPRRSRRSPLPLATLAEARRLLAGHDPAGVDAPWRELVSALDLQVVPGVFAARSEGRGEAMTVQVDCIWRPGLEREPEGGIEARLLWLSPEGEERLARREPVSVAALRAGFPMYVRPPESDAGAWRLVLELRTALATVRSLPVVVECVESLDRLAEGVADDADPVPSSTRELSQRLRAARRFGLRAWNGLPVADWTATGEVPVRWHFSARAEEHGGTVWGTSPPGGKPSRVYLLLTTGREHPTDLLAGTVGEAWLRVAESQGARVLAARVPLPGTAGFDFCRFVQGVRDDAGTSSIVLVARGDAGRVLPGLLVADACRAVEALVLAETPAARVSMPEELDLPVLRIVLGAEADRSEGLDSGARRARVERRAPAPVGQVGIPDAVAAWAARL